MKNIKITLILIIISFTSYSQSASEIITKAEDRMRGKSLYAEMKITTVRTA